MSTTETTTPPPKKTETPPKKVEPTQVDENLPQFEKSLADSITKKFPNSEIAYVRQNRVRLNIKKEDIAEVAKFTRDDMNFDHAESVSGVDYPDQKEIEVVYHLGSYTEPTLSSQILVLATRAPREDDPNPGNDTTRIPSLCEIYPSVSFHERECFEMLGVYFTGHPDNRRMLLPEDWADIPPLRKDFDNKGR